MGMGYKGLVASCKNIKIWALYLLIEQKEIGSVFGQWSSVAQRKMVGQDLVRHTACLQDDWLIVFFLFLLDLVDKKSKNVSGLVLLKQQ